MLLTHTKPTTTTALAPKSYQSATAESPDSQPQSRQAGTTHHHRCGEYTNDVGTALTPSLISRTCRASPAWQSHAHQGIVVHPGIKHQGNKTTGQQANQSVTEQRAREGGSLTFQTRCRVLLPRRRFRRGR